MLNWHWDCPDPPPPLDLSKITVCTSCNIAISVRVGSPGDSGDLSQTIASQATAVATGVGQTVQSVFEPTAAPLPPIAPIAPDVPWLAPPVRASGVAFLAGGGGMPFEAGVLFEGPPPDDSAEDPPRHGAPPAFGVRRSPLPEAHGVAARITPLRRSGQLTSPQRPTAGRAGAGSSSAAGARRPSRGPAPPLAPPPAPDPIVLAAGPAAAHGGGPGAVAAFVSALTLIFLYAIYSALRTGPAVPPARDTGANPHPPG